MEFRWSDPDAEKVHEGLLNIISVVTEVRDGVSAVMAELTRTLPPSPVPGLLTDIIARLERIEARLP